MTTEENKTTAESTAFKRRWPIGKTLTKPEITIFAKKFPKDDKLPTRMEVIRAGIEEDIDAQSVCDAMEVIFQNNEWGPRETDAARRRVFRALENPKVKKPRGRPVLTEEEQKEKDEAAAAKALAKTQKADEKKQAKIDKALVKSEKAALVKKIKAEKAEAAEAKVEAAEAKAKAKAEAAK